MTVYAIQRQMKFDRELGELVPRFSGLDRASSFGPIEYILGPTDDLFDSESFLGKMHSSLSGFSDDDLLLLIGNPVFIGVSVAIAAYYNGGSIRVLQWSAKNEAYYEIKMKIL